MAREKSDDRVVPKGRRKPVPIAAIERGGKAITQSEHVVQLGLHFGTADSSKEDAAGADASELAPATSALPKPKRTKSTRLRPMTMEEVADEENLRSAFERVASNDGAAGPDGESIEDVREHFDDLLVALHLKLLDGNFRVGDVRRVWIPKAAGGKRGLGIPNVIDRIVQQATYQVLSPFYERTFHDSSHGFRPGRSCHTAIAEAKVHLENGYEWVVDIDLSKFFDTVHHQRLLDRLARDVHDARVIKLIRQMLRAKVIMPDGVVMSFESGTPQGGPLSPLLSNVVLDELDRELSARGHRFVRYADDCNIYVRSERAGHRVMTSITRFIERRLRLSVNAEKSAVARPEDRHFLGFSLRSNSETDTVDVLISRRSRDQLETTIRRLTARNWGQSIDACIARLNSYLRGWLAFFGICTEAEVRLLHNVDAHVRRRLRALQLKQWKRKATIAKRLARVTRSAWRIVYRGRRSWWSLSNSPIVHKAMPTASFVKRGLIALEHEWAITHSKLAIGPTQLTLRLG